MICLSVCLSHPCGELTCDKQLIFIAQYYVAVVEVCLCAANQKDPQDLALHHYKSGRPENDVQGMSALAERCGLYRIIHMYQIKFSVCM